MKRFILFILVTQFLSFAACKEKSSTPSVPQAQAVPPGVFQSPVLEVPASRMKEAFLSEYHLQPDRRAMMAIAEIHNLLSGQKKNLAGARPARGKWSIVYNNEAVGELPEFPDFADFKNLLQQWTVKTAKQHGFEFLSGSKTVPSGDLPFLMPASIDRLRKLGAQWNRKQADSAILIDASRILVSLSFQSLDQLEIADLVPARALAMIAVAQSLNGTPMLKAECLLAHVMGYSKHASNLATMLPENDAVRLFMDQEDDRLKDLAFGSTASEETKYLYLARLALKRDATAWTRIASELIEDQEASLSLLKSGLDVKRFEMAGLSRYVQPLVLKQILATTQPGADPTRLFTYDAAALTKQFEQELENYTKQQSGPFWDGEYSAAFLRGYFYSAPDFEGRHYLDSLSSVQAAKEFHAQLGQSSSHIESQFQLWYSRLLDAFQGKSNERALVRDLSSLNSLGAPSLMRWVQQMIKRLPVNSREFSVVARQLATRFDSRLSHRLFLQEIAYSRLADLKLAEKLCRSVVDSVAPGSAEGMKCAHFIGEDEWILKILHSPKQDFSSRATALFLLKRDSSDRQLVLKEFQNSIRLQPDNWSLRSQYVEFLRDGNDFSGALAAIQDWLAKYGADSSGFDAIHAHIRLAHTYNMMGQYGKAWAAIEPVVRSGQSNALMEAADIQDRLKRKQESQKLVNSAMERYPGSLQIRIDTAKILWRNEKYTGAAQLFTTFKYPITYHDWCEPVATGFAEVFSKQKEDIVLVALSSMLQSGIKAADLNCVDNKIEENGKTKLAFAVYDKLFQGGGMPQNAFLDGYDYLLKIKNQKEALDWICAKIPAPQRNPYSISALQRGEYSLLWDFVQQPNPNDHVNVVWLFRAVAFVKQKGNDSHSAQLLQYYNQPSQDFIHQLGRYLMGLTSETELLQTAITPSFKCQASYYIGVKAHAEGRYDDASDWYRISVETGEERDLSFQYAYDTLFKWANTGRGIWFTKKEKL